VWPHRPRSLGIETSCDETSAAVVEGRGDDVTLRSLVILSQDVHALFGGVVPELASRATSRRSIRGRRALADAGVAPAELDGVASRTRRGSSARCSSA
jgi:N6-L-threonylcarbamoyladenine synthase